MWPYWSMYLSALLGLSFSTRPTGAWNLYWYVVVGWCAFLIGTRHEVGADWVSYLNYFGSMETMTFVEALQLDEPGYYGLNWIVQRLGGEIYALNSLCALLVMVGVSVFAREQPLPWLALTTSIPYLVIVVSMGYSRQGAALGLVLLGLSALARERTRAFVVWVVLASLFHKSAVLVFPIAALSTTKKRVWTFFWVGATAGTAAYFLVAEKSEELWRSYVEEQMESEGGLIRVGMNAVASVVFLSVGSRMRLRFAEQRLWWWMAVFALACFPLVRSFSTAIDRVALYFIPLQIFAFSRLPSVSSSSLGRTALIASIAGYYGLVLWVWMNFASHATLWIPYQSIWF